MENIVFQGVIIGAGTIILGLGAWLTIMVFKISVNSEIFPKELKALRESFSELKVAINLLAEERKLIDSHERDIQDINKNLNMHRKSIRATERFLGTKYGSEYLEVYEKVQDSTS